ncbi:MAG: SsrA-binding protein SmpB [Synergistota bacterium]|nr:SsrA-binding protein SmpB [Synergistota bacterium]HHV53105.1 SsrA-binding protein SmpB [Synergistaceae bacterium]
MPNKVVARNRKATHDYFILETYEAGIVLTGTEIKSVREGRVNLRDGYAKIDSGELWLYNVHISPYERGSFYNHDPLRPRKLLLRREEIKRLLGKTKEKGLTLVPLSMYIKDNRWAKVEVALAKGKKQYDKRAAIAERDAQRAMERARRVAVRNE